MPRVTNHDHGAMLGDRRILVFTLLYAAEGAPIGFIWWALPTLLREAAVPIEAITGLTAVVLLPWVFKFLWAPAVDALRGSRWGYRAWIVTAQMIMGVTLLPLAVLDPVTHFGLWRVLLLTHAFAAATQDVAIDALAISSVEPSNRGWLNGCMQAGMLTGRSLFGGGALLVAAWVGREWMIVLLVAWIWLALAALLVAGPQEPPVVGGQSGGAFGQALADALRRRITWIGIAFALTAAAAFEAAGQLAGPFLVDRGVSSQAIGVFFGLPVVGAMLAGGLVGGALADRWGRVRAVTTFLCGFVAAILALAVLDASGPSPAPLVHMALLTTMYLFVGLFTAASYALFMDLTDPRLGGTQFSTYMAATNACESWATWTGGRIAGSLGYPSAFAAMSLVSLLSLPVVKRVGTRDRLR